MKPAVTLVASVVLSAFVAGSVVAADDAASCNDIRWKTSILKKYPGIEKSCVGVVKRDGKQYVRVSGKVHSKDNGVLKVRLENTQSDIAWKPAKGDTVSIEGKATPAMDVVVGQHLHFYMLEDKVIDLTDTSATPREVVPSTP